MFKNVQKIRNKLYSYIFLMQRKNKTARILGQSHECSDCPLIPIE